MTVQVEQIGGTTAKATARTHSVLVDRPTAKGGDDRGPLGGEYLLVSLGGCFMSNVVAAARAREAELSNLKIEVAATVDESPQRFTAITLTMDPDGQDPELLRKLATIAERSCIVTNTLKRSLPITVTIS